MSPRWRWTILGIGLGLYLIGLGFLGGIVAERVRFDRQRLTVLNRYDEAGRDWRAYLMRLETADSRPMRAAERDSEP